MPTGKQYAKEALKVFNLTPKAGYIWGTMNKLWTASDQAALEKKYKSDPNRYNDLELGAKLGKKWIGHRVWDCSGLTKYCGQQLGLSYYHGSNSSYNKDCSHKGIKTAGMKLPVGAWVYTGKSANSHPHIGIVVDSSTVIEAQGTNAGVIKSSIDLKKWTYWGLGKGLTFDFIPGESSKSSQEIGTAVKDEKKTTTAKKKVSYPTLKRGSTGELVTQLQMLLARDGSSLAVDGIFGPGTQSAVRAFQKKHKLEVDGIVGPKTWSELLKLT